MDYFVITNSDGDTQIERLTGAQLRERLAQSYWGEAEPRFYDTVFDRTDPAYWNDGTLLIIRGDVFVPQAVQRTTEWSVP